MKDAAALPRRAGRPLSFDRDQVLERAMHLFWRRGYEGASVAALTEAMGVTPPSLYAAFGDKRRLFLEAVDRYRAAGAPAPGREPSTAREAAAALLRGAAETFTGADTPPGCLLASAAVTGSPESADVQAHLSAIRREVEAGLRARLERAVREGELPPDADADALAGHVMAVVQGLSTLARDGADRAKLLRVADAALAGWPTPGQTERRRP